MTARIARTSCLLAVVASLLMLSAATARAAPTLPGIDVSQWQQTIDWSKVAGAGMRFAIARATKGQRYIDPTFQTNVDDARAEGIVVGAYHRATPSGGANANITDARAEPELLDGQHGQHHMVRRPRVPSMARALGCVLSDGPRERMAGPRLDLLAVDAQTGTAGRHDGSRPGSVPRDQPRH